MNINFGKINFGKIIFVTYTLTIARTTLVFYNNKKRLLGQDRSIYEPPEMEHLNQVVVLFKMTKSSSQLKPTILKRLIHELQDKQHPARRVITTRKSVKYLDMNAEQLATLIFRPTQKSFDDVCYKQVAKMALQTPNRLIYYVADDGFAISFSHTHMDGVASFNIATTSMDKPSKVITPHYKYIPVFNELKTIYGCAKVLATKIPKQYLTLHYPQHSSDTRWGVRHAYNLSIIKKLKKQITATVGYPISFPAVFACLQAMNIFSASEKTKISLGIVIAFNNKNRHNNFSALPVEIHRPKSWTTLGQNNFYTMFLELIKIVQKQVNKGKYKVSCFYSLTNIYNVGISLNKTIDVLVSGLPMCQNAQHTINGIEVGEIYAEMPYHTSPVYISYFSDFHFVYTTISIRTNDVDYRKVKQFSEQVDAWLESAVLAK